MDRPARPLVKKAGPRSREQEAAHLEYEAELQGHMAFAEAALQQDVVAVPDTIYSGLQEAGYYSADPEIDADPAIAAKASSLLQLVKEHSVSPSGRWEMTLTDREIAAVDAGRWCSNCYQDQEAIAAEGSWEERMVRLEARIGPRPADAAPDTRCPCCGDKLGIHGVIQPEALTGPDAFTPEQQMLVEEFYQGIYTVQQEGDRAISR